MKSELKLANGFTLAVAAAGAFAALIAGGCAYDEIFATRAGSKCEHSTVCKGHGSCKTAQNACKGQNDCKGTGFTWQQSNAECKAAQAAAQSDRQNGSAPPSAPSGS